MPRLEPAPGLCPPGASAGPARFTPSLGVPADSTLPASTCAVSARAQGEVATRCLLPCPFLNLVHGVTSTERLRPETREPSSHSAISNPKPAHRFYLPCPSSPPFSPLQGWTKPPPASPRTPLGRSHSPASFLYAAATVILHNRKPIMGDWLRALRWLSMDLAQSPRPPVTPSGCPPGQVVTSSGSLSKPPAKSALTAPCGFPPQHL